MLCIFGLLHGITEMTDWVRFIIKTLGMQESQPLLYVSQICLVFSFVFLLQFAVNLMTYRDAKKRSLRVVPFVLVAVFIAVLFVLGTGDIRRVGLLARYSFGFAGSLLTAVMLFKLAIDAKILENRKLIVGLNVCATGFGSYAVFGGLIVDPLLGLPIQLFRAACAVVIATASSAILDVFKVD
jgi:hypothetical protein